jgi:hypothetical protein
LQRPQAKSNEGGAWVTGAAWQIIDQSLPAPTRRVRLSGAPVDVAFGHYSLVLDVGGSSRHARPILRANATKRGTFATTFNELPEEQRSKIARAN